MKFRQSKITKVLTTNSYDVNCLQILVLRAIYMFTTNQYVNNEYLSIHGILEAILKMVATEKDADGCWMRL